MNKGSPKILVIERNEEMRSALCNFLQNLGYFITETNLVEDAVHLALVEFPDLILIDISNDKALEVIYQIRQQSELSGIPILTCSADGGLGIELYSNLEKFGTDFIGYLTKPLSFDDLADQIKSILPRQRAAA